MSDELEVTKKGIVIPWDIIARWAWALVLALISGHFWYTTTNFTAVTRSQVKQDERMDRIEKAIVDCLAEKERHEINK